MEENKLEFEIKTIIDRVILDIKQEIRRLGPIKEMSEKQLTQYYIFSGQICVLEKINREIRKFFKVLKKEETVCRKTNTVSCNE